MRTALAFGFGALLGAGITVLPRLTAHLRAAWKEKRPVAESGGERLHIERTFNFLAKAPLEAVAPLFGADKERDWAPEWNPVFVWPRKATDRQGMVFTVVHGDRRAVWVNTAFEPMEGHIQYAYVIPEAMATSITLRLTPEGRWTRVTVEYARTALSADANGFVRRMAEHDGGQGPEWGERINLYLETQRK